MTAIKCIDATTAQEFWDILSPLNPLFSGDIPTIIYRGQSDASWRLTPSLLRGKLFEPKNASNNTTDRIFFELRVLQEFFKHCDQVGIRIPGDSKTFREENLDLSTDSSYYSFAKKPILWPNENLLEAMAFAQHYGLPTRLLDWSYNAYVATYFAVSGALKNIDSPKTDHKLAVWALKTLELARDIQVLKVPSADNKNIAAQSGCFTLIRQKGYQHGPFEGTHNLDEYLENERCDTRLTKITLPITEAKSLFEICKKFHISGATIYPDAYGAANATIDNINTW